jgi:hypothetical protein
MRNRAASGRAVIRAVEHRLPELGKPYIGV